MTVGPNICAIQKHFINIVEELKICTSLLGCLNKNAVTFISLGSFSTCMPVDDILKISYITCVYIYE